MEPTKKQTPETEKEKEKKEESPEGTGTPNFDAEEIKKMISEAVTSAVSETIKKEIEPIKTDFSSLKQSLHDSFLQTPPQADKEADYMQSLIQDFQKGV